MQKSPFSRDSREFRDSRDFGEPPDCGKQRRIRSISRDSRDFRDSRDSSRKTPFVMTPFSGPEFFGFPKRLRRMPETPIVTTSQKSTAVHLQCVVWQYTSNLQCSAFGACEERKCFQYSSHLYRGMPPICIAIHLPFASQHFWQKFLVVVVTRMVPRGTLTTRAPPQKVSSNSPCYHWTENHYITSRYFSEFVMSDVM